MGGQLRPLLPVDEFASRVEVSGVAGGLGDRVEQDLPKIVQAPLALGRGPPDQVGIWGGVGDDDFRQGRLAAVVLPD